MAKSIGLTMLTIKVVLIRSDLGLRCLQTFSKKRRFGYFWFKISIYFFSYNVQQSVTAARKSH